MNGRVATCCAVLGLAALAARAQQPVPVAAEAKATAPATVATHYFYWYRHPDEHFGGRGREGHLHQFVEPEHVRYDDPAWHRREFADMAAVGIDVALPVYWGFPGSDARPNVRFSNVGLVAMVDALDAMDRAGEAHPRLGMFYDTSTLANGVRGVAPPDVRADLTAAPGQTLFCDTVLGFFARIPVRHWARHRGRPLVVLYTSGFASRWDAGLGDVLRARFAARFDGERPFVVADVSFGDIGQDATTEWGAALNGPRVHGGVVQIGPGYDDSPVPGRTTPQRPREDGAFYRAGWRAAIAAAPELVLIETWNEMHEGTEVCRTVETGDRYLTATRDGIERLRRGEPGPPVALEHTAPLPRPDRTWGEEAVDRTELRWRAGDEHGVRPRAWEDGPITVDDAVLTSPGSAGDGVRYVYFQVSDYWAFDTTRDLEVAVRARVAPGDGLALEYDSRDAQATLAGAYTLAASVPVPRMARAEQGHHDEFVFRLPGARFANRQNGGADLRLIVRGARVELAELVVRPPRGS